MLLRHGAQMFGSCQACQSLGLLTWGRLTFDLFLQNNGLEHVDDCEHRVGAGLLKSNGNKIKGNETEKDFGHHMVSMSDVELDGALRGGGEPEDDDLALGDDRGPLHLLQKPSSHTLTSVWDVCGDPKYLKNFTLEG